MKNTGDIPDRDDVMPPEAAQLSPSACAKVAMVKGVLEGGVGHVYCKSVNDVADGENEDEHLYGYNTHCFVEEGWIFFHGDDEDKWIAGDDIGFIERHYE